MGGYEEKDPKGGSMDGRWKGGDRDERDAEKKKKRRQEVMRENEGTALRARPDAKRWRGEAREWMSGEQGGG